MADTYWLKQTADQPLFENLLWSRPENRQARGKLLIVGGNLHGFAAAAEAYAEAEKAGAGSIRVVLPGAVQKLVGGFFDNAYFADSTPSGSFSRQALAELVEHAAWADGVFIAGDLGRNSETAIMLEKFMSDYSGQVTLSKDAADYFKDTPAPVVDRPDTTLVVSFAQLQKLAANSGFATAFKFSMPLLQVVEALHGFSQAHRANIVVKHLDYVVVAAGGRVSTTQLSEAAEKWRVRTAAHAGVWWLQNPEKPFEAITTSLIAK